MQRLSPLSLASLVTVSACGGPDSPAAGPTSLDSTATVFVAGEVTSFTLDPCERDDQSVHVTGRGESGETLDAVAEIRGDEGDTVAPAPSSSLTALGLDQGDLSTVGPDAWTEQGMTGPAPGDMAASRLTDDLVQMAGQRIAVIDDDGQPTDEELESFSLDAHCEFEG